MANVNLTCPTPGLSVPMPPYYVTVKADGEGSHDVVRTTVEGHGTRTITEKGTQRRVGAPVVKGQVTEPGPVKRLVFDDDGKCEVDADAWKAFSKNGAHTSYGIVKAKAKPKAKAK